MAYKKYKNKTVKNDTFVREDEIVYVSRSAGKLLSKKKAPSLIDLFSGAGGLTLGFTKFEGHNFQPVWANDNNKYAVDTYNLNFGNHCVFGDIEEIIAKQKNKIIKADVVIGGPPCQGFSLLNKNRDGDQRKELWRPFMDVVKLSNASIFVIENVPQILGTYEHGEITECAKEMGFKVAFGKLCAADYGAPQLRWRAFIIGCKHYDPNLIFPPKKTHYNPELNKNKLWEKKKDEYITNPRAWVTVREAIGNLGKPVGTEIRKIDPPLDLHFGRTPTPTSLERYKAIPKEGMNRFDLLKNAPHITPDCWIRKKTGGTDLFGRLWWDKPAFTIRTEFFKPEKGRYLHPSAHRPITHREAARIQTFPDSFKFVGTKIEIAKQIGNAVPPSLAARIADVVYALWLKKDD